MSQTDHLLHACNVSPAQDLAILNDPVMHKDKGASGQNTNAGWFNRYIQTGRSDHETKSNGSIGGADYTLCCACCIRIARYAHLLVAFHPHVHLTSQLSSIISHTVIVSLILSM